MNSVAQSSPQINNDIPHPAVYADADPLLSLDKVLEVIPISRELWLSGVKSGRFPLAIRLTPRRSAWRTSEIVRLINNLKDKSHE